MISFRPSMNSERFLHRESIAYPSATFPGSRVFQLSLARRTFWMAVSRVNGGKGGRVAVVEVGMISSLSAVSSLLANGTFPASFVFSITRIRGRSRCGG